MAIRHELPSETWPTREAAAAGRWFTPLRLGPVTAATRTWVPAMVPWRATDDGLVTPDVLDWYGRFAEGRPGVLVVEATGVRDVPSGPLLRIGHDRFLPGLEQLVATVRERSGGETRLFIQVIDFLSVRRRPVPEKFFGRYLVVDDALRGRLADALEEDRWRGPDTSETDVRAVLLAAPREVVEKALSERDLDALDRGYRESVSDMHLPHVRSLPTVLPDLFADAAARARDAGFDGVELHYAHAYTMAGFLSRLNVRDDGYGGARENRLRLPLEVFAAVRERVGHDVAVGCRFLTDEIIEGGSRVEDAEAYGVAFARAGMDFLSLSRGGKFEDAKQPRVGWAVYPYTGPSGHECMPTIRIDERGPFGRNVADTARVRAAVRAAGLETPVVVAGGVTTYTQAEEILANEQADAVGAARQSLADPDWFEKVRRGRGSEVRRCTYTNYCEGLDQVHKKVTCKLWDREFTKGDPSVSTSDDGRRRLLAPRWEE